MGKWNRRYYARPRRRNYQDYQWSPPRYEPCPDPETEVWQDNVPMWEKKFCYLVGRMPWKKILSTKKFTNCQSNVLTWDDFAGEEAFLNAKKRFWEEINGLPCETQLPNPDMYIDEIDWNPYIDPDLVRDLDREYFNPDDKYYLPSTCSPKGNDGWPNDSDGPWERGYLQNCTVKNKTEDWNQWDNSGNDTSRSNKDDNPWESHHIQESEGLKDKGTGWKQWDNTADDTTKLNKDSDPWESHHNMWGRAANNYHSDTSKNWNANGNSWRKGGNEWQDRGASSRGWNQKTGELYKASFPNNSYRNTTQEYVFGSHRGSSMPNGRGNGNQWGQKWRHNYNPEAKYSGSMYRGRGPLNAGCRKREGPDYYTANHNGPRLRGDGQSSYYWNGGNNKRVTFGGQWS